MPGLPRLFFVVSCFLLALSRAIAAPVINEIMFHPPGSPGENHAQEWIEIFNPEIAAVNVGGWKLTQGVTFTIPAGTTIPGNGYLVIAADVATFSADHPGFAGMVVGGWTGRLSNSGEQIQLDDDDPLVGKVNDVTYGRDGDWGLRGRGDLSFSHRGWDWFNDADGGGKTLELRNPALGNGNGENWGVSTAVGGSPGAANSLASTNIAPLIKDAKHRPEIPHSSDPIVVSCDLEDESGSATATLRWRLDGAGSFNSLAMTDTDGDGDVEATIPSGQANLAVIEWYISATDGTFTRTWPAPARTSNPGVLPETFGQVTNALVQVDNGFNANATFRATADQPIYRLIMTNAERLELAQIGSTSGEEDSEAEMHGTFISHDGTGVKTRYRCGFRNRGFGSALGPPNNYHVTFLKSERWNDRDSMALNCRYGYSQTLGQALAARAGLPTQDAAIVKVRVNGADLALTGGIMYGRYVRLEGRNNDWVERHYPNDADGNLYRLDDHFPGPIGSPPGNLGSGEFRYEGTDGASYEDTILKETNKDAADYTDLINLCRIVSAPAAGGTAEQPAISDVAYPAAVATVLDLDNFYRYFATDALNGNQEGGLQSGRADDASIYAGTLDQRFRFVPHDLDDVFDIGNEAGNPITRSIFSYDGGTSPGTGVLGLERMFNHPALVPRYYATVLEALNTWFNHATIDPIIDQIMAGWVPPTDGNPSTPNRGIAEIKDYITQRTANILGQIQQNYSLNVTVGGTTTPEGYQRTNDGSATFSGTFNVAKTYSATVNGQLVTALNQRTTSTVTQGTWSFVVPAGGGSVLHPGLNIVVVRFWDGVGGTGNIVNEFTTKLLWQPVTPTYTNVSGTLAPAGSLAIMAPASYIPGIPFLVRVDLKDAAGNLDRTAWNRTATLTGTNGVTLNPATVTLTNGMGSALVTAGGGGGGGSQTIFVYGTGGTGVVGSGTPGSTWKGLVNLTTATIGSVPATWKDEGFNDTSWASFATQTGYGNSDENTPFADIDYDPVLAGSQNVPSYLFRSTFTITDVSQVVNLTGQIKYDDAYAIYVNGQDIGLRSANLPAGTPLTSYSSGTSADNATANVTIPASALHNGVNTIAVEIHQGTATDTDVTFDLRLQTNFASVDPGNFTLSAAVGALNANKALTSLTPTPAMTNVSGTLPPGTTNWSGVMNVTGDVTVPAGATLNIAAGTHVLLTGDSGAGTQVSTDIIVNGALNATGTLAQPISFTGNAANNRWGELTIDGTAAMQFCLVSHAAHSDHGGHTATGPAIRLLSATLTLDDSVVSDLPGKTITTEAAGGSNVNNSDLTIRRTHFARCVMGPEIGGAALLLEDSNLTEMLPAYRETGSADDEDNIYIHSSGGRPVNIRRSVFSNSGDDGIDLLAGAVTVEDCIVRNIFDKGMSLLQNDVVVRRTQIIDCDFCISTKTQIGDEAAPYTLTLENCTLVGEAHPTNQSDQSGGVYWHNVGVHVRNKYGTGPDAQLFVNAKNCIISAITPMLNDYAVGGNNFPLLTSTYNCYQDVAGTNPVDPAPPAGTGDIAADPLFADAAGKDFHLTPASPCRDTGDPASPLDADGSRADMGALPYGTTTSGAGTLTWTSAAGPYRVTAATTVPANLTLIIQPGTAVYFDQNVRLTVNGNVQAVGTADRHITFSHVPGTVAAGDADPIKLGTQTGPPKWGGIRIFDSMAVENVFKYCDFINAQGTSPSGSENYGSLGFIRSWGHVQGCTWAGTHLRMCYGRNSKLTVFRNTFPDMFIFDPVLGRIEEPTTDFIAAADNNMEPLKVEFPTTDPEVSGNVNFPNGMPLNGHWRCYYNTFNGNRGHQDVFDCDSGRWAPRDVNGNQTNGQFVIDCRYNHFYGLAGDEHMDLGGDAYIAANIFENAMKDYWTNDTGYSNAISSGDKGTGTTILLARNVCYDLDHVINLKANTATIFEHNTVANIHADFQFVGQTVTQNVVCAPINFFIPGDGGAPTNGDGAYLGFNIISNVPHVFSGPDASSGGPITTKIEFFHNLLNQIADPVIGPNHPGGYFSGTYGPNQSGAPGFVNAAGEDYSLRPDSLARGATVAGFDYGAGIPEWAYLLGGPVHGSTTPSTSASFTVGGPGIVAYKWRLDGGAWSASVQIGDGGLFSRSQPCVRQATLNLSSLSAGSHTLEVLGQDMAGNWQDADPARTLEGLAQATPTARMWTVDPSFVPIRLSEILSDSATLPDSVEVQNIGGSTVSLTGWSLTDDPLFPSKFPLSGNLVTGGFANFSGANLALDKDGDTLYLYQGTTLRDSVTFGQQVTDKPLIRHPATGAWTLGNPTPGAPNTPIPVGDFSTVRINEWFASGDALYDSDWIELVNTNSNPVLLTGLRVTDNRPGDASAYTFPALSFIGGGGFVRLIADGTSSPGHLSFALDAEYEVLSLLNVDASVLDTVAFYPQTTDWSMGRDGSGGLVFYELPTRGFLNGTSDPAYANALEILRHLRISELMYNGVGGPDFDYVELTNTGSTPLALGGAKFVTGITFTFPTLTLNPGGFVVVVKHLAKFRSRYGNGPVVAGVFSGQLDNGGETLGLQLPPPYDANVLTFGYNDSWYVVTDGNGRSLVVIAPSTTPAGEWGDHDTWQPSAEIGGNPAGATATPLTFSGWSALHIVQTVTSDDDRDGVAALVEFELGMSNENPNGGDGQAGLPAIGRAPDGRATLSFLVPENAAAVQNHGFADVIYNVQAANAVGVWTTIATKSFGTSWSGAGTATVGAASGGFVPVTITDTAAPGTPQRFLRLQAVWAP